MCKGTPKPGVIFIIIQLWLISPLNYVKLPVFWQTLLLFHCGIFFLPSSSSCFLKLCTQVSLSESVCFHVYLVSSKWVAVSWHWSATAGNCVPNTTLQVVAAEQRTKHEHHSFYQNPLLPSTHHEAAHSEGQIQFVSLCLGVYHMLC